MIFIKISKKNIVKIVCVVCTVLILGTGVFGIIEIDKLNESNKVLEEKIVGLNKEIKEKEEKLKKTEEELKVSNEWLKIKDDRIVELEGELEKVKGEVNKTKITNNNKKDSNKEISDNKETSANKDNLTIPNGFNTFKSYMDYKCIRKDCKQGKIVYGENAWTDEDGLRKSGEYYCVALGSYYGNVGDKFIIETKKGNKYKVIKADEKADKHTDSSNRYTLSNGCMIEWIVETNKLDKFVKSSGNIDNIKKVSGAIIKITKIKE